MGGSEGVTARDGSLADLSLKLSPGSTPSASAATTYPPPPHAVPSSNRDYDQDELDDGRDDNSNQGADEHRSVRSFTTAPIGNPSSQSFQDDHDHTATSPRQTPTAVNNRTRAHTDLRDPSTEEQNAGGVQASTNNDPPADPTPSAMTPALQVRLSLTRRLWSGVSQLAGRSKFTLIFTGFFTIAQIAIYITMLVLSNARHEQCEKPLKTYLALNVARLAITYPLNFYHSLAPPRRPPRGEEDTPESRAAREARRVIGSPKMDARLRSISDLVAIFALVWFLLGNVWLYSDTDCRKTSPLLWYTTLTTLIIAYLRLAEVAVIIFAVVFFLPVVILGLRLFGGVAKKHEIGPLSKDEISKLPIVLYIPKPAEPEVSAGEQNGDEQRKDEVPATVPTPNSPKEQPPAPTANTPATHHRRRTQWLRLLFKRKRDNTAHGTSAGAPPSPTTAGYVSTPYPLHPLPDNLSSCPICLCDYEAPRLLSDAETISKEDLKKEIDELEPLNLLPCGHTLHKDCLGPWLQTSGRCPVCQRAVFPENDEQGKKKRRRRRPTISTNTTEAANQGANTAPTARTVTVSTITSTNGNAAAGPL